MGKTDDTKTKKRGASKKQDKPSAKNMREFCRRMAEQIANSRHGCGMWP